MTYRNVKTGATITTDSKLGGDWMPIEPPKKEAPKPKKGTAKK